MVANEIDIIKKGDKYRTKGFGKYIGREIEINIPIEEEIVEHIVGEIYKKVKKKEVIKDGSEDKNILSCKIYYKYKDGAVVIVFPDKKMHYPWEEQCDKMFKDQI